MHEHENPPSPYPAPNDADRLADEREEAARAAELHAMGLSLATARINAAIDFHGQPLVDGHLASSAAAADAEAQLSRLAAQRVEHYISLGMGRLSAERMASGECYGSRVLDGAMTPAQRAAERAMRRRSE